MDLSIFEQALALRAEVDKAGLDDAEPNFSAIIKQSGNNTSTGGNAAGIVKPPDAPNDKIALDFILRGAALAAAAAAQAADGNAAASDIKERQSRLADMLRRASEPLPDFDPKAINHNTLRPPSTKPSATPPIVTQPATPIITQPPQAPPVAAPPATIAPVPTRPVVAQPVTTRPPTVPAKPNAKAAKKSAPAKVSKETKGAKRAKKAAPKTPPKKNR